ncbi:MAG: ATP-binding protein [Planctomycetota bacterium]
MIVLKRFSLVLLCGMQPAFASTVDRSTPSPAPGLQYRIARSIRPSLRNDEHLLGELLDRLKKLPPLSRGRRGASAGYHSRYYDSADHRTEILLDMGSRCDFDRVVIFSVDAVFQGRTIDGYGFPQQFRIDVADEVSFDESTVVFDSSTSNRTVDPEFPLQILTPNASARFLRLTILKHWSRGDGQFLTALGEIMILSGGRNMAIGARVDADTFTSLPDWSRENLVDGQTDLGLPIDPTPSASNGFLSRPTVVPQTKKWVQVELERTARIDEVRLIPTEPFDAPSQHGHGFPRRFRVVGSRTDDFTDAEVIADHRAVDFLNPGDNPVILRAPNMDAKFIRLEIDELWHISNGKFALALAEMQVFGNGQNLAAGCVVTASDVFRKPPFDQVWHPKFLVDGFSSQNRLIGLDRWLTGLQSRAETERQIDQLRVRMRRTVEGTISALLILAAAMITGLLGLAVMARTRRRRALARQKEELRTRIARDLHDDLGSRLGGMTLISESLLADQALPESLHGDLSLIHRSSREASDAMRDIVWLLDNTKAHRSKLIAHMRQIVPTIMGRVVVEFTVDETLDQTLDFDFRRQILFAFKECLGNAAKHSEAERVDCRIGGGIDRFQFEVQDHGKGFQVAPNQTDPGHGLNNLRARADSLGGSVTIHSRPSVGTRIVFDVPLQRRRGA